MQQRVGIARAFSVEPDVLIMDEPFSHLDAITARSLRRELEDLWRQTGKTVLFVTHDVGEAVELSQRVIIFAPGGRMVDDIGIDLPYPRESTNDDVALAKAQILRRFEELDLLAS
jgi:NitT/TauT family transport system ATP-binding protein